MDVFKIIWDSFRGSPSILYPAFQIPDNRILDEEQESKPFEANQHYFDIRIKEQFLKYRREYWNEYNPLTVVLSEFIYANEKHAFPFVVGPDLLKSIEQLDGSESVRYKNTRVVGPTPYRGDQVALFTGLFRLKTKDWALQSLKLLESVAGAFDSSKLTEYLNIADPLMEGINGFFGMGNKIQFRIGQRIEFTDASTAAANPFRSGYWVMIREGSKALDKTQFWIKDGQLFQGTSKSKIKPYMENDYLVYAINRSDTRGDYSTFEFHKKWEDVRDAIWDGNMTTARESYKMLIGSMRASHDLIEVQKKQLQIMYMAHFKREEQAYNDIINPPVTSRSGTSAEKKILGINTDILNRLKLNKSAKGAIILADIYLKHIDQHEPKPHADLPIDETYIFNALHSDPLKDEEIAKVDLQELAAAASLITDIDLMN